jgi:amino acid adenylation domain-containing protein
MSTALEGTDGARSKTDELFEALFRAAAATPAQRITRQNAVDPIPLSFAQERLWFLDQLEPGNPAYNVVRAFRLTGRLDLTVLEACLDEIVHRQEALRTTFGIVDGQPLQIIAPVSRLQRCSQSQSRFWSLSVIDLRTLPEPEQQARVQHLLAKKSRQRFDLAQGPLLRITLLRLAEEEYVLLLVIHHIVSDGWSIGVFFRELAALYEAFSTGKPSPLPELPIRYVDYVLWQREWLTGEVLETQLAYWEQQLGGAPPVLELPTDRPRPPIQTYGGARRPVVFPRALCHELKTLAQQEGATLFMTLLAAFNTLLYRYTGQEDITVGSPIANRNQMEVQDLIGCFVNTLALRTDLSGNPTFRELLGRVRKVALEGYAHQDLPFERLVEELRPERNLGHSPLFQVMLVLQNTPTPTLQFSHVTLEAVEVDNGTSKFDLALILEESAGEVFGSLEYNTDLFDEATIGRMIGQYRTLLEGIVAHAGRPVSELPLLTKGERQQLLVEWNDTQTDYPKDKCLHELFEAQVERAPEAVALVFESERLTYGDLDRRANQLAHHLQRLGVGPEVLVGVYMERSLETVIALYGILKAGGAYVPLDPEHPADRVAFMLEDTQVPALLTQQRLVEGLPEHGAQVLCLDSQWQTIAQESVDNPGSGATADNLAYVIYTSGSTGRPKGAMNTHCGICNRLLWMQDAYHLTEADRVLQKTPYCFDVSVWEFFWPLLVGARLVVAQPGGHKDSAYLVRTIVDQGITTLHFVPSMLQLFLEDEDVEACRSLKRVICSGEALPYELQQRFFARLDTELHNLYGPTEAAVDVSYWQCRPESKLKTVPIGRPVANTQLYILDRYMQPVPIGVAGELHIGGVQVARGYLNRPELTAERFIPDPFRDEPGARLYKTGDLVRYLPDGNIDFLGRLDFQVKLRGFRIELGEIEAVLSQHPAVREAVVLLREDVPGDKRLVAYVVPKSQALLTIGELRAYLKEGLPEYMVPAAFVPLEALPLTPNGKVDRRSLPAPRWECQSEEAYVAPENELQGIIACIWCELLQVDRVGLDDSFFDLGGHSLLIVQAHRRLSEVTDRELAITDMFRFPTIRTLAQYLIQDFGDGDQITIQKSTDRAQTRRAAMLRRQQYRRQTSTQNIDQHLEITEDGR